MPRALVDTTVRFAAVYRREESHDDALPILPGMDAGTLSEAVILESVLAETLTGLLPILGTRPPSTCSIASRRTRDSTSRI
jgi:predicted nucleic acid-binding protein